MAKKAEDYKIDSKKEIVEEKRKRGFVQDISRDPLFRTHRSQKGSASTLTSSVEGGEGIGSSSRSDEVRRGFLVLEKRRTGGTGVKKHKGGLLSTTGPSRSGFLVIVKSARQKGEGG